MAKKSIYPLVCNPPPLLPFNECEKAITRRFGSKVLTVTYSGRDDLVGYKLVGTKTGFIVEAGKFTRFIRLLDRDAFGNVWRTKRTLRLRYRDSLHDLVPGLWSYVR